MKKHSGQWIPDAQQLADEAKARGDAAWVRVLEVDPEWPSRTMHTVKVELAMDLLKDFEWGEEAEGDDRR